MWSKINNKNIYNYLDTEKIKLINKTINSEIIGFDLIRYITPQFNNKKKSNKNYIKYDLVKNNIYIIIYKQSRYFYIINININNNNINNIKIYLYKNVYFDIINNIHFNVSPLGNYYCIHYKKLYKSKFIYLKYIKMVIYTLSRKKKYASYFSIIKNNIYKKEYYAYHSYYSFYEYDDFIYKTVNYYYKNYNIYIKNYLYAILTKYFCIKNLFI